MTSNLVAETPVTKKKPLSELGQLISNVPGVVYKRSDENFRRSCGFRDGGSGGLCQGGSSRCLLGKNDAP